MRHLILPVLVLIIFLTICIDSGPRGIIFKKADYGDKWPFSVEEIDVYCAGLNKNEIYFRSGEKTYALNGKALGAVKTRKSAETFDTYRDIWLDDPKNRNTI